MGAGVGRDLLKVVVAPGEVGGLQDGLRDTARDGVAVPSGHLGKQDRAWFGEG